MKIVQGLHQGSSDWLQCRSTRFGSSEAAAMLGLSPYTTRSELLRIKHTGLDREFSDWFQRNVLDKGHRVEEATRPMIEAQINDVLYPATVEGHGRLVASCDGLTLDGELVWECKQWAEALAAEVQAGRVPDTHMPQCQHLLLVTGADRLFFTVSDGTGERLVSTEVLPDQAWFQRLQDGWAQFEKDLAAYVPPPVAEPVRAEPIESLPAVAVRLDGALTVAGNLPTFAQALREFIARIPAKPATDTEFATTEAACKALKKAEEALDAAEAGALASITDVEAMRRAVADCRKLARDTRLAAEKLVERRKAEIKESAVMAARRALDDHIAALNGELAPMRLEQVPADFAGAIKGLRSIASMQDALDVALAQAKIIADAQARVIRGNIATFKQRAAGVEFLFSDLSLLVHKAADDFAAVLEARIAKHQADQAAREAQRQREESVRIAAAERLAREQAEARAMADAQAQHAASSVQPVAPPVAAVRPAAAPSKPEPATLKLGVICERLGFGVTAAFLADTLHVRAAATAGRTVLYRESQWPVICAQLQAHISAMAELYGQQEAA